MWCDIYDMQNLQRMHALPLHIKLNLVPVISRVFKLLGQESPAVTWVLLPQPKHMCLSDLTSDSGSRGKQNRGGSAGEEF